MFSFPCVRNGFKDKGVIGCFHKWTPSLVPAALGAGRTCGQQSHTPREAKQGRFTQVISADKITARTYRSPRAEAPPAPQAEVGMGVGGGSGFGAFS